MLSIYKHLKPTTMKKIMIFGILMASGVVFSQSKKPYLEQEGTLVKATYYYDNGNVQQQGYFKDGKLDGVWTSFDENGNKKSSGEYKNGEKTGKWFFWNKETLAEVDYSSSQIKSIKNWKQEGLANRN